MKKNAFIDTAAILAVSIAILIGISSCSKSKVSPPAVIKFSATSSTFSESQGAINVDITLSDKASQDITLTYKWNGLDSATYLGGDFMIVSAMPLIIKAGESTAKISLQIMDDAQIDNTDFIVLTLISATNATVSTTLTDSQHTVTVTDNDVMPPADKIQVDLTWKITSAATSPPDINIVNLDLYAQYDVVIVGNTITDQGTTNSFSANATGFETLFINAGDPDKVYFLAVPYLSGSSNIKLALALNGWGYANGTGGANIGFADFASGEVGNALFFGEFNKVGNTFVFTGRSTETRILKFKVSDFKPRKTG